MKKTVAVIFGGRSVEHDVSIITAHTPIIDTLINFSEYQVIPVYISKEGIWYSDQKMISMDYFKDKNLDKKINSLDKLQVLFDDGLWLLWPRVFGDKKRKVDIVFPAMHGTYGEDGSLAGLLRMAKVPFVGCDMTSSAICMDKSLTKQILRSKNIPVVKDICFVDTEWHQNKENILNNIKELKYPMFIKPVHLGSSIGITKANNEEELINGIEVALHYDDKILVEEAVQNLIEVTLPIMGNDDPILASIERPLNKTQFFDFNEKYLSASGKKNVGGVNNAYSEIPANIKEELSDKVKSLALKTYKILGCSGIARVDFLIDGNTEDVYVNEINTLPGSLYHHNWRKSGYSNVDLIKNLIKFAVDRFNQSKSINLNFDSKILLNFGGNKGGQ